MYYHGTNTCLYNSNGGVSIILGTYKSGFWFLPSVLFNCISVSIITLITRKKRTLIIILLIVAIIYMLSPDEIIDGKYTCMYFFFIVGYIFNMQKKRHYVIKKSIFFAPLVVIALVICSLLYDGSMYVYVKEISISNNEAFTLKGLYNELQRYAVRSIGSLSFIYLLAWYDVLPIKLKNIFCSLGRYSLGVYCTTTIMLTVYYKALGNMHINIPHNYIYPIILAIALVLITYKFFYYCEKKPMLNQLFLGGR